MLLFSCLLGSIAMLVVSLYVFISGLVQDEDDRGLVEGNTECVRHLLKGSLKGNKGRIVFYAVFSTVEYHLMREQDIKKGLNFQY